MPNSLVKKGVTTTTSILVETGLAPSKSEARRLLKQGAVKIDDKIIKDSDKEIEKKDGMIIQKGKRNFVQLKT